MHRAYVCSCGHCCKPLRAHRNGGLPGLMSVGCLCRCDLVRGTRITVIDSVKGHSWEAPDLRANAPSGSGTCHEMITSADKRVTKQIRASVTKACSMAAFAIDRLASSVLTRQRPCCRPSAEPTRKPQIPELNTAAVRYDTRQVCQSLSLRHTCKPPLRGATALQALISRQEDAFPLAATRALLLRQHSSTALPVRETP